MSSDNVIYLTEDQQSAKLRQAISFALNRGQSLILGTSEPDRRYRQLQALFPDACLEFVDIKGTEGIKIWKRKN